MLVWLHAVGEGRLSDLTELTSGPWAKLTASEDPFTDPRAPLSAAAFREALARVSPAIFELAGSVGAKLEPTVSGTRYDLRKRFERASRTTLDRHMSLWALEMFWKRSCARVPQSTSR